MNKMYLGKYVNTHGIKGEFRIKSDILDKDIIFKIGNIIYIDNMPLEIMSYRVHKGYDMVTVKNHLDIDLVLPFKGKNVYFDRDSINIDHYLVNDLIGLDVIFMNELCGKIVDFMYNSSNCLLEVLNNENHYYIPNQPYFIKNVDFIKKQVIVENIKEFIK